MIFGRNRKAGLHERTQGVHSPSWNSVAWGVELVGDYSKELLNRSLLANAVSALATLHGSLGLGPNSMKLHREDHLQLISASGAQSQRPPS